MSVAVAMVVAVVVSVVFQVEVRVKSTVVIRGLGGGCLSVWMLRGRSCIIDEEGGEGERE